MKKKKGEFADVMVFVRETLETFRGKILPLFFLLMTQFSFVEFFYFDSVESLKSECAHSNRDRPGLIFTVMLNKKKLKYEAQFPYKRGVNTCFP